jgi:DNA-binding NtrC family response regulator
MPVKQAAIELLGDSPSLSDLFRRLLDAARVDAPVLIAGELGTGKESAAAIIHSQSRRRHGRFVAVDCVALPETLREVEIFGYVKGAFTTGVRHGPALCERADGGTLYLAHVDALSNHLQAKLLRLVEHGEYTPLGGSAVLRSNVRLVASATRDLGELVHRGTFNEALYRRLQAVVVDVPPLRERGRDRAVRRRREHEKPLPVYLGTVTPDGPSPGTPGAHKTRKRPPTRPAAPPIAVATASLNGVPMM